MEEILMTRFLAYKNGFINGKYDFLGSVVTNQAMINVNVLEDTIKEDWFLFGYTDAIEFYDDRFSKGLDIRNIRTNDIVKDLYAKRVTDYNVTNKEIIKKIFAYAIPFIIIDIAVSVYNFIDMVLIMHTLNYLNLDATTIEFSATAISTWSAKIGMIVNSVAMGMSVSLIPTIVSAYTLKKWNEVNDKLNQALQLILISSVPMVVGISLLSKPIWSIFYGYNINGAIILSWHIFTSLFFNIYVVTSSTLQSLNKFKAVYLSTLSGFLANALLDVPIMIFYSKINIPPYLGAITASIIGYMLSIIIAFVSLAKTCNLKYKQTFKVMFKMILPLILMILVVILLKGILPVNYTSKLSCIIYDFSIGIVGAIVYLFVSFKMGIVKEVLGPKMTNKIIKKLTFGKLSV